MIGFEAQELSSQVQKHFWWHSIDLGHGCITPGQKNLEIMRREYDNTFGPLDLQGRSLLDVGAWNGAFSIEAKKRGASRVVALDHATWNSPTLRGRASFDLAVKASGFEIMGIDCDLDSPGFSLARLGRFDIVLFLGVFYHLRDPLTALRELAAVTAGTLVLETHLEQSADKRPLMIFYPGAELNDDGSNWWGPNRSCVEALLRMHGFKHIAFREGSDPSRGIFHANR